MVSIPQLPNPENGLTVPHDTPMASMLAQAEQSHSPEEPPYSTELEATRRLLWVGTELIQADDIGEICGHVLDSAREILRSDFASIHRVDPDRSSELRLQGFRGFTPEAARSWERVRPESEDTCGLAWRTGRRIEVSDVETCGFMAGSSYLDMYRQAGIRAIQTTPLLSRSGRLVGTISTHWRRPHQSSERELALLDVLAQLAGTAIERRQSELSLRTAHDTLRHLVEHSPFGVYVVDADFRLVQVSAGAQKLFENVRPLIGRDFAEVLRCILPEPFASDTIGRFRHTLATGEPNHAPSTIECRKETGDVESHDWKIERVIMPDARPGVMCHFYDLSERQRYERALRESEAAFRAMFSVSSVGKHEIDPETGRYLRVNAALCELTGYSEAELLERTVFDITHPEERERDYEAGRRMTAGEVQVFDVEKRYIRKDGRVVWVRATANPIRDDSGRSLRNTGVVLDITERKQAEERARLLLQELNHRAKNMLNLVQVIARRTVARDPEDFIARFCERIQALAASQDLLVRDDWQGVDLEDLVCAQLAHFADLVGSRIIVHGPRLRLNSAAAQTIGLALHELATNAGKYG